MSQRSGLVLTMFDVAADAEDELNRWVETEDLPALMKIPGFLAVRRYEIAIGEPVKEPKYLIIADLESPATAQSADFRRLEDSEQARRMAQHTSNVVRRVYTLEWPPANEAPEWPRQAQAIMVVMADPPPERDEEYSAWYLTEHFQRFLQVPGFLRAQRFRNVGEGYKYLTMYDLTDTSVFMSEGFKWALDTPWTRRVGTFASRRLRNVYRLVQSLG